MHRTIESSSRALKYSSCLGLVLVLALGSPTSAGTQPPTPTPAVDGLFLPLGGGLSAEVQGALAGSVQGNPLLADGVIRSRRVAIDFALLGERVQGLLNRPDADPVQDQAPLLLLNFFDDASVEVLVDSVEPAVLENGYVVSGSVPGQPGSVVLVVHADTNDRVVAVSGSASTAEGAFRLSTIGGGTYSIEEIDASVPWVDGVLPDEPELADPPPSPSPDAGGAAFSLVDPPVSAASSGVSEIDVLVLYTPAAAAYAGGEASMRAKVELLFGETNTAFRNSGVSARVGGWSRPVSYVESQDVGTDLRLLRGSFDGYLDEVHSMRSDLGADLVHLLVAFTPTSSSDGSYTCGIASTALQSSEAFGVTLFYSGCRYTFTHELGHNLGLWHDRYQHFAYGSFRSAHVPYAYGYSNAATFSPIGGGQCWYTVMAYYKHCFDVPGGRGFATPVLRFSSPYRRHPSSGEPLGVLGEVETYSVYGPADAARALERTRAHVAAYYHRPDPPAVTGVDLAVPRNTVSVSPVVVDIGESVFVQASVANMGAGLVSSSTVSFWSQYDESGAEWVRRASKTPGGLSAGSSKMVTWRGTGGSNPGTEYWAVCIAASGDVDPDNDCALAGETVVIRDPDAVEGGELVADSSGELAVGATGEIEFVVNDVTGEEFQMQPHWFLLGYEPVDEVVWGDISKWVCLEDVRSDCWNDDHTENTDAEWDWRVRAWGFGSDGTFLALLGLEAYSWSDADKWRFTFGEATRASEEPDAEFTWRFGALRVTEDLLTGQSSGSREAVDLVGTGAGGLSPVVGALPRGEALQIPRALQDAFRPVPSILTTPMIDRPR